MFRPSSRIGVQGSRSPSLSSALSRAFSPRSPSPSPPLPVNPRSPSISLLLVVRLSIHFRFSLFTLPHTATASFRGHEIAAASKESERGSQHPRPLRQLAHAKISRLFDGQFVKIPRTSLAISFLPVTTSNSPPEDEYACQLVHPRLLDLAVYDYFLLGKLRLTLTWLSSGYYARVIPSRKGTIVFQAYPFKPNDYARANFAHRASIARYARPRKVSLREVRHDSFL